MARRLRGPHEFRSLAEVSAQAGCHHFAGGFATPDDGGGIGERSGSGFYGNGFAGQGRLVEKDIAIHDPDVGGRKIAHPEMDGIAGNQICGGHRLPPAVAEHARPRRQPAAQQRQRLVCSALLDKADCGVERQECTDDRRFSALVEQNLDQDRRFKHPRNWTPELFQ